MKFLLNRSIIETNLPEGSAAVDYIRQEAGLTGTKVACREGDCGACTVLLGELKNGRVTYRAVNSCLLPLGMVRGRHLVTIEGLNGADLTPIQAAMVKEGATQCGFCACGIVVSIVGAMMDAGCDRHRLEEALFGHICRCTGYGSIVRAIDRMMPVVDRRRTQGPDQHLERLIEEGIVPLYFTQAPSLLASLNETSPEPALPGSISVGGGTDLMVQIAQAVERGPVVFIRPDGPTTIREVNGELIIDAAVTFDELSQSERFIQVVPRIKDYMRLMASPQIRRVATLGGNVANASPIGDMSIIFLALNARLEIESENGRRSVPLEDFFLGYKTLDLKKGDIIRRIAVSSEPPTAFNFERVSRRKHMDIASVNSAFAAWCKGDWIDKVRISAGGIAPIPLFLKNTSFALKGKSISWRSAVEASASAGMEASPISDIRGSAEYKSRLLKRLIIAHFHTLFGVEGALP